MAVTTRQRMLKLTRILLVAFTLTFTAPATELFLSLARGLDVVPYKGSTLVTDALLGGRIPFFFADPVTGMQQARGGKARALSVTNANRISWVDTPTDRSVADKNQGSGCLDVPC